MSSSQLTSLSSSSTARAEGENEASASSSPPPRSSALSPAAGTAGLPSPAAAPAGRTVRQRKVSQSAAVKNAGAEREDSAGGRGEEDDECMLTEDGAEEEEEDHDDEEKKKRTEEEKGKQRRRGGREKKLLWADNKDKDEKSRLNYALSDGSLAEVLRSSCVYTEDQLLKVLQLPVPLSLGQRLVGLSFKGYISTHFSADNPQPRRYASPPPSATAPHKHQRGAIRT